MPITTRKEVLRPVTHQEAISCINDALNIRVCRVSNGKVEYRKPLSAVEFVYRVINAEEAGMLCICDDTAAPGYALAAFNQKLGLWERFECDLVRVADLEPFYRNRIPQAV